MSKKKDKREEKLIITPTPKKPKGDEELIQKFYNTSPGPGKKMLLGLIRLKYPDFKDE